MLKKYLMLILYSVFFALLLSLLANTLNHVQLSTTTTIVLLILNVLIQIIVYCYVEVRFVLAILHQVARIDCKLDITPLHRMDIYPSQDISIHTRTTFQLNVIRC